MIKMLSTRLGSEDGVTVREYAEGQDYDLSGSEGAKALEAVFVAQGWAAHVGGTVTVNEEQPLAAWAAEVEEAAKTESKRRRTAKAAE